MRSIKFFKQKLILSCLMLGFSQTYSAVIEAEADGGVWRNDSTWVGGVQPTIEDTVVINGTVYVNGSIDCGGLTINEGAILTHPDNQSGELTVTGNVLNNGEIIRNENSIYKFDFFLHGDITNNGVWKPRNVALEGDSDRTITHTEGKPFQNLEFIKSSAEGKIYAIGDLTFGSKVNFQRGELVVENNSTTTFQNKVIYGTISGDSVTIISDHVTNPDSLWFQTMYFMLEHLTFEGEVQVFDSMYVSGNLTNSGTMVNRNGKLSDLYLKGSMTNNGKVLNAEDNFFHLHINGDIINNGVWAPTDLLLEGAGDRTISQNDTSRFGGRDIINQIDSGAIVSGSDLKIDANLAFTDQEFRLQDNSTLSVTAAVQTVHFTGDTLTIDVDTSAFLQAVQFKNAKTILTGYPSLHDSIHVEGDLVNQGMLNNKKGVSTVLAVDGKFTNSGELKELNDGGQTFMTFFRGNIQNDGVWMPTYTYLTGTGDRVIGQSDSVSFGGVIIYNDITEGRLNAETDIHVKAKLEFANNEISFANHKSLYTSSFLNDLIITGDTTALFVSDSARLYNVGSNANLITLNGNVEVFDSLRIRNNVVVADTLNNWGTARSVFYFEGDVHNNGVVQSANGGSVVAHLNGDLINDGVWSIKESAFKDSLSQIIMPNNPLQGKVSFAVKGSGDSYTWVKNKDAIEGMTDSVLVLDSLTQSDLGGYYVKENILGKLFYVLGKDQDTLDVFNFIMGISISSSSEMSSSEESSSSQDELSSSGSSSSTDINPIRNLGELGIYSALNLNAQGFSLEASTANITVELYSLTGELMDSHRIHSTGLTQKQWNIKLSGVYYVTIRKDGLTDAYLLSNYSR